MKFPYDYIALTAVPAFCVGALAGALAVSWLVSRWTARRDAERSAPCGSTR